MAEFRMPSLGADMEAGTLVEWKVQAGDRVKRGDIIAVVETQKGAVDVEVFDSGLVEQLTVPIGQPVPVGTVLALIRTSDEAPPDVATTTAMPSSPPDGERHRISPIARKLADQLGINLATIVGTGPGGAIQKADVERAAATNPAPPTAPVTAQPIAPAIARPAAPEMPPPTGAPAASAAARHSAMRSAIARAMARSKREIPHYYLSLDIDLSPALTWLERENLGRPVADRLLPAILLLKAAALALREVPELNGFWEAETFQPSDAIHLGVAISLRQGGLVAPAIHHADLLSLDELMAALRDLVKRARTDRLRSSELTDPTITVTNLGEQGVSTVFGVIYPPQVALVGFGAIVERPWATNGLLGVRPVVTATLAADHRASDGHRGGLYLAAVNRRLQAPEQLLSTAL